MSPDTAFAVLGVLGVAVVFSSRAVRELPVSEPLVALAVGVLLGPEVLDVARFEDDLALLHTVSEIVVAIALMAVALRFDWPVVRRHLRPVAVMLTLGMAGMAAVVAGLAWWLLGVGAGTAVLVGGILAPTDPVLSSSIVTGGPARRVLPRRVRALLSIESGFNDGLALPLVVAGIVLVLDDGAGRFGIDGVWAVAVAVVAGWLLGVAAGEAFRGLEERREVEDSAFFVFTLVLALFVLGVVNLLEGDGILGVFVAGLAYNRQVGSSIYEQEREVEEGINRILVLPAFILLGVLLPWSDWASMGARVAAFAVAVLVLRRLPLVLAIRSMLGLDAATAAFYGWFGPMGLAALFFATLAHEEHAAVPEVWPAVALVVAGSTVVHGITATPARRLLARVAGERGEG